MSDVSHNKDLVRRYHDALNSGSLTELDHVFADTYIDHASRLGPEPTLTGVAAGRQTVLATWEQFPGARLTVEDLVAEDDRVAVRWRLESDRYGGIAALSVPTRVIVTGMSFYRVEAGRIAERWVSLGMSVE